MKLRLLFTTVMLFLLLSLGTSSYSKNDVILSLKLLYKDKNNVLQPIERIPPKGKYFIKFTPSRDGYVSLWRVDTSNQITRLYPNEQYNSAEVREGETYSVSSKGLHVKGSSGYESYLLVWTNDKSDQLVLPNNPKNSASQKLLQNQLKKLIISNKARIARSRLKIIDNDQIYELIQEGSKKPNKKLKLKGYSGNVYILAMSVNIPPLRRTHKDVGKFVRTMKRLFSNNGNEVIVKKKINVSLNGFENGINWLKQAKRSDLVFIYFSGHGTKVDDINGDDKGKDEAFVLKNKIIITDDKYFEWISAFKGINIITVADACFSKGLRKTSINQSNGVIKYYDMDGDNEVVANPKDSMNLRKNTLVASASENGIARESSSGGVFTNKLVRALENKKNIGFSLKEIFRKVSGNNIVWGKEKNGILKRIILSE